MYQNGSSHMDGPVGVSQCEIPPGSSFTYNFTVDQIGTYWFVTTLCMLGHDLTFPGTIHITGANTLMV